MVIFIVVGVYIAFALFHRFVIFRVRREYEGKHVVITGASEGICRCLAEDFYEKGAKVTIMARTQSKLERALEEITSSPKRFKLSSINFVCMDVTKTETVKPAIEKAIELHGDIDVLILGAGCAYPGYFLDQDEDIFEKTIQLNYMGILRCLKAAVPLMLESPVSNQHVVLIGSSCSVVSFLGYSSYAPSKYAARGLADSLRNEFKGMGISIHMAYPPDTDTPGFKRENQQKPKETFQISPPDVYSPKSVCKAIIDGMSREEYHILGPDLVQNLLVTTMAGVSPRSRWAPITILLQPLLALGEIFSGLLADMIAKGYGENAKEEAIFKKTRGK